MCVCVCVCVCVNSIDMDECILSNAGCGELVNGGFKEAILKTDRSLNILCGTKYCRRFLFDNVDVCIYA